MKTDFSSAVEYKCENEMFLIIASTGKKCQFFKV